VVSCVLRLLSVCSCVLRLLIVLQEKAEALRRQQEAQRRNQELEALKVSVLSLLTTVQ